MRGDGSSSTHIARLEDACPVINCLCSTPLSNVIKLAIAKWLCHAILILLRGWTLLSATTDANTSAQKFIDALLCTCQRLTLSKVISV